MISSRTPILTNFHSYSSFSMVVHEYRMKKLEACGFLVMITNNNVKISKDQNIPKFYKSGIEGYTLNGIFLVE